MGTEIERKFLVDPNKLPKLPRMNELEQGYLADAPEIRVRMEYREGYKHYWITVKSPKAELERKEVEAEIDNGKGREMLAMCAKRVFKSRYIITYEGHHWTVDHYYDLGFWMAEVELEKPDEQVVLPPWVEGEVTGDPAYYARNLAK